MATCWICGKTIENDIDWFGENDPIDICHECDALEFSIELSDIYKIMEAENREEFFR